MAALCAALGVRIACRDYIVIQGVCDDVSTTIIRGRTKAIVLNTEIKGKEIKLRVALKAHFNGPIELVMSPHLPSNFIMAVDEEGKINGLPKNDFGSWLYEADLHGDVIVGDVFLMKIKQSPDTSHNVVGLTNEDIQDLAARFQLELVSAADA